MIDSLKEDSFSASIYLSPFNLAEFNVNFFEVNRELNHQESQDLLFDRLISDEFTLENYLFLSALKLSNLISENFERKLDVLMVGFDFMYESGYSEKIGNKNLDTSEYAAFIVNSQKEYLEKVINLNLFDQIEIFHIGNETFSRKFKSHQSKKRLKKDSTRLYDIYKSLVESDKVILTAEFTTNHFGKIDNLIEMVQIAKDCGADLVKVQKRDVDTFYTNHQLNSSYESPFGKTFRDYRKQLELTDSDFNTLAETCLELEIPWFVSTLDKVSYDYIKKFACPLIKLPSTISEKKEFLKTVSNEYLGDLIISTGMTDKYYQDFILENFKKCNRLFLLQCNSAYPTPPEDCNIAVINEYAKISETNDKIIPGYSSHDIGSLGSCMAVSAGAKMIEKHVKLGSNHWAHFDSVALDLKSDDFKNFVNDVRLAEKIYGQSEKKVNFSEHHKY